MAFWTDSTAQDPKRQYRFLVTISGIENGATWYAKKVNKPAFTISSAQHQYLNHTYYYPGRIEWQPVTVTLVDPVSPDALAETLSVVAASGYRVPGAGIRVPQVDTTTISKASAVDALGGVEIAQIDNLGNRIETWNLNGAFITDVSYSELDYGSDDLVEIMLKFQYDWADCVTGINASGKSGGSVVNDFFKQGTGGTGF